MAEKISFELNQLAEPSGRAFQFDTAQGLQDGFVVRFAGQFRAYHNSCPHTGVNLNWSDDQFFDFENQFLQCSLHGALFDPLDGRCVRGPCQGQYLQALPVELVEQQVIIYI